MFYYLDICESGLIEFKGITVMMLTQHIHVPHDWCHIWGKHQNPRPIFSNSGLQGQSVSRGKLQQEQSFIFKAIVNIHF